MRWRGRCERSRKIAVCWRLPLLAQGTPRCGVQPVAARAVSSCLRPVDVSARSGHTRIAGHAHAPEREAGQPHQTCQQAAAGTTTKPKPTAQLASSTPRRTRSPRTTWRCRTRAFVPSAAGTPASANASTATRTADQTRTRDAPRHQQRSATPDTRQAQRRPTPGARAAEHKASRSAVRRDGGAAPAPPALLGDMGRSTRVGGCEEEGRGWVGPGTSTAGHHEGWQTTAGRSRRKNVP
jgi:hypothetical protein